jgi:hypothetical protein
VAKVALAVLDELPAQTGIVADGERPGPDVRTRIAFGEARASIHLRQHDLPVGASIDWTDSKAGHLAYIWSGSAEVDGQMLNPGSMLLVEHRASAVLTAGKEGCSLIAFCPNPAAGNEATRAGGHVHVLPVEQVPRVARMRPTSTTGAALFANSQCPTCEFWLHENDFTEGDFVVEPHYHSEDEIILVIGGEIVLGRRTYGRGTAIAIERNTVYGFQTGPRGLSFINFRPSHPSYARAGARETVDELNFYQLLDPLPYQAAAAPT